MKKGFTILELLAVVIVLGLITAIAIVGVGRLIESGKVVKVVGDSQIILSGAETYFGINTAETSVTLQKLIDEEYITRISSDYNTASTVVTNANLDTLELWFVGATDAAFTGITYETVDSNANKTNISTALGY